MIRIRLFDIDRWEEIFLTLKTNKMRSVLTAFGIFWGVFMLVLLMGGSNGLQSMLTSNFTGFATNSYFVSAGQTTLPYKGFRKGRKWDMEIADLHRLRQRLPEIETATPVFAIWGANIVFNNREMNSTLRGIDVDFARVESPDITQGRYFNESDVQNGRKVCIIGKRVAEELFPGIPNPCGNQIRMQGVYFQVIGVNGRTGMSAMGNSATTIQLPYTTMQHIFRMGNKIQSMAITVKPGYRVSDIAPKVDAIIKRSHQIHPEDKEAVWGLNMEAMFKLVDNLFHGISILVWMIGLGTLFTGAVGVSNIMMVTVRERTAEIGIRRAIGARPRDILWQILSEGMVLTLLAGMSGIILAVWTLQGVEAIVKAQNDLDASFQVSFGLAVGAALLLALLGGLAGLAPAYRALGIKPIEAIRDE